MEGDITSVVKQRVVSIKEESKDNDIIVSEPNQTKDDDKLITGAEVAMQPNVPIKSTIKRTKHKIGNPRNEPGLRTQKTGRLTDMEIPDNEIVNRSNNTRRVQQSQTLYESQKSANSSVASIGGQKPAIRKS